MPFKRITDASYPNVYETWTTGDSTWIIQDLRPEDDDEAIKVLVNHLCTDETLCQIQKLREDPASVFHISEFWREVLTQRMSLGCYEHKNEQTTLVALNVCVVTSADEHHDEERTSVQDPRHQRHGDGVHRHRLTEASSVLWLPDHCRNTHQGTGRCGLALPKGR